MSKSVLDIVAEHLKREGLDGLFNEYGCACELADLAPCGEMSQECIAGRKQYVTQADIDAARFDHWDDPPRVGDWYMTSGSVQGLSGDDTVKPKMFHGGDPQDSDS